MKFKSDIEVQAGLKDSSGANGTAGQVLSSNGSTVSWINETTVASDIQNEVKAGVAINKGQAVYVTGADGTNIIVGLASNTTEATSSKTLGLLNATVAINGFADVVQIGKLSGLNTSAATVGDPVWLGTNGNLIYGLANKPYAPAHLVFIGVVTRVNANNGEIFINVQNGFELNEIHDVDIQTNVPIDGDILGYNGTLWVNKTIAEWLGYTPANDAGVVKLIGDQTIAGIKTFSSATNVSDLYVNGVSGVSGKVSLKQANSAAFSGIGYTTITALASSELILNFRQSDASNKTIQINASLIGSIPRVFQFPDTSGTIALTSDIAGYVPYTGATGNVNLGSYSITANSFIKAGGNSTQYLKADGSVSTAMNSRIEVNFIATSGQTTFATTYEVGQVEVYYNGSKLYPDEFVATNGTTIVLVTPATLNAQISIVKFVSSFNTTSVRTETVFTTTSSQTTFNVNYAIGQVDVFYNGSKLSPAEFTATNGTSVVLGFACAAGESIVIDSFVNQVSGAVGTANKVAKFTGAASLGDSQIDDNGTNVSVGYTTNPNAYKLDVNGTGRIKGSFVTELDSTYNMGIKNEFVSQYITKTRFGRWTSNSNIEISYDIEGAEVAAITRNYAGATLKFNRQATTDMLITGSGYTKMSNTGSFYSNGGPYHEMYSTSENNDSLILTNSSGSPYGQWLRFTSSPNNATNYFLLGSDGTNSKFVIYSNGNIVNRNNSYGGISDIKYKENITDATSKLEDIMQLKVRNFNFIGDESKQIGFIAQEFEEVFPSIVDVTTEKAEEGVEPETYKSIKTSVLTPILVKAMQELAEQVKELKAEIEILKNK